MTYDLSSKVNVMNQEILQEYARLAVRIGVNVQKDQPIRITGPVEAYAFLRLCAKEAYDAGASEVIIEHNDEILTRLKYEHVETDLLKQVPQHRLDYIKSLIDRKYCTLSVISPDPDLLKGIDPEKINTVMMERSKAFEPYQYYTTNNIGQWSIIAYPNQVWAKKVFPDLADDEALSKLWEAILSASRVKENESAAAAWDKHNQEIRKHSDKLNKFNFKTLHFKNSKGTDLTVGLIPEHIWEGGYDISASGVKFNPNIPTEEVFTMPDRRHIDGVVYSTKPLAYGGQIIDEFMLEFKDGEVINYDAKTNKETLKNMLATDRGSKSLGEVALISYDSPISNTNILFYNTLFDENASCHLALGTCYPTNVKGGTKMSDEELYEKGGNNSMIHVDFMFGSSDMEVTGVDQKGNEIKVFENGNFCI